MTKTLALAILLPFAGTGTAATDFIDTAPVIASTPVVEYIAEPRQECSAASAATPAPSQPRDYTGAVLGGIAGGLLGAQVGKGNGKTAAAAVGAAVGAMVGDNVQNAQRTAAATAPQCHTVQVTREVIRGYSVVYHYSGRDVTVMLPYDPGPTVRVGVGIVDAAPAAGAPTASMMGSNVRDVRPAPTHERVTAPVTTSNTGGYPYRY